MPQFRRGSPQHGHDGRHGQVPRPGWPGPVFWAALTRRPSLSYRAGRELPPSLPARPDFRRFASFFQVSGGALLAVAQRLDTGGDLLAVERAVQRIVIRQDQVARLFADSVRQVAALFVFPVSLVYGVA